VNLSPRAAAALARLCIQKLMKELGESGDNLNRDIAELVKKGLEVEVQPALDVVRVIGNNTVHPGAIDLKDNKQTALTLLGLVKYDHRAEDRDMPPPLLCTQIRAKFPREARKAVSPSSSIATLRPRRANPQAIAAPTRPLPITAKSNSACGALAMQMS
jgi:hypothetical protein